MSMILIIADALMICLSMDAMISFLTPGERSSLLGACSLAHALWVTEFVGQIIVAPSFKYKSAIWQT